MSYDKQVTAWIESGISNNELYLLVLKDLEDQEYFPIYFKFYSDSKRYLENIISESKVKVVELIRLDQYKTLQ